MKKIIAILLSLLCVLAVSAAQEKEKSETSGKFLLHDDVLAVDYSLESYYVLSGKMLQVELFGKTGTFNIYCTDSDGRRVALCSTRDLFDSTEFLVKVDGIVFHMVKSNSVKKELRRLDSGAQLVYTFADGFRFVIDFSLIASRSSQPEDIVQISLYSINENSFIRSVDVKGIFDTICGELSSVHFSTAHGTKIRNENRFSASELESERAVISSNGCVSYQFVLNGQNVSPLESVTFANINELYKMDWNSGYRKGRGFSNIRGYDDSAVMLDWDAFFLEPGEKKDLVFYIAAAADESPRGLAYVDGSSFAEPNIKEIPAVEEKPKLAEKKTDKRTDVEFILPPIRDYQLDPAYIQDLIDRIDALQSSENVDHKKISQLNAELDAILEKLRRR